METSCWAPNSSTHAHTLEQHMRAVLSLAVAHSTWQRTDGWERERYRKKEGARLSYRVGVRADFGYSAQKASGRKHHREKRLTPLPLSLPHSELPSGSGCFWIEYLYVGGLLWMQKHGRSSHRATHDSDQIGPRSYTQILNQRLNFCTTLVTGQVRGVKIR